MSARLGTSHFNLLTRFAQGAAKTDLQVAARDAHFGRNPPAFNVTVQSNTAMAAVCRLRWKSCVSNSLGVKVVCTADIAAGTSTAPRSDQYVRCGDV